MLPPEFLGLFFLGVFGFTVVYSLFFFLFLVCSGVFFWEPWEGFCFDMFLCFLVFLVVVVLPFR